MSVLDDQADGSTNADNARRALRERSHQALRTRRVAPWPPLWRRRNEREHSWAGVRTTPLLCPAQVAGGRTGAVLAGDDLEPDFKHDCITA